MPTLETPIPSRMAPVRVGDIVESSGHNPLMFVQEVSAGSARCAWIQLNDVQEAVFPLAVLRRVPVPA